jgi:acetoin utilization protein AcuC
MSASAARTALLHTPEYARYDYGPAHPLRIVRLQLTYDLMAATGLLALSGVALPGVEPASEADLARFHDPAYLAVLRAVDGGRPVSRAWAYGLGTPDNPCFPGVYGWSALVAGGSLAAARLVDEGAARCAFHFAGGLHHAGAARASGFCYVNDPALAIEALRRRGRRVAYVDIDAHHGDGVQWAFYDSPDVLTISLHESGQTLFPGTGFVEEIGRGAGEGYAVNVPLAPGTDDAVFAWAFDAVVPPLLEAFRPDVVVTQLGVDAHRSDPLTNLELTLNGFAHAVRRLRPLAPRWVALGGGGYDLTNVPRAWALAWAIMNDREPDERLPADVSAAWARLGLEGLALTDPPHPAEGSVAARARRFAEAQVRWLQERVFPRHGL